MFTTLISAGQLNTHLADYRVVDCRFSLTDTEQGTRAYQSAHIPGAVYAHLDHDLSSPITPDSGRHPLPDFDKFLGTLRNWGIEHSTQLVAYDDAGGFYASRFWWLMKALGHEAVAVLDGGFPAWQAAGFALSNSVPHCAPSHYHASPNRKLWLDLPELQAALDDQSIRLIDARTPERFSGQSEPLDPVAGHIPGAVNQPVSLNLDERGRFQPIETLQKNYSPHSEEAKPAALVHYCGSGVFACHGILAMAHAGLGMSQLYPGSWSEWIRDPARPIATSAK